ncbi:unnamed protein product [Arabis nemorensis]|uniref:Uncharacterized protein n=1 Tax=Arabis nemorensis TaxID=586526 RepID=A0A565CS62_9BRAS|nr:unnamed protein product [Arabis nemorensis]
MPKEIATSRARFIASVPAHKAELTRLRPEESWNRGTWFASLKSHPIPQSPVVSIHAASTKPVEAPDSVLGTDWIGAKMGGFGSWS